MSKPTIDLFALGVFLSREARHIHPNPWPPVPTVPRPRDYVVRPIGQRDGEPTDGELDDMFRDMNREANEQIEAEQRELTSPGNFHDN